MTDDESNAKEANEHHLKQAEEAYEAAMNATDPVQQAVADNIRDSDEPVSKVVAAGTSDFHGRKSEDYAAAHMLKENVTTALREATKSANDLGLEGTAAVQAAHSFLYHALSAESLAMQGEETDVPTLDLGDRNAGNILNDFLGNDLQPSYGMEEAIYDHILTGNEIEALRDEYGRDLDLLEVTADELADAYLNQGTYKNKGAAYSRAKPQERMFGIPQTLYEEE